MFSRAFSAATALASSVVQAADKAAAVYAEERKRTSSKHDDEPEVFPEQGDSLEFVSSFEAFGAAAAANVSDRIGDTLGKLKSQPCKAHLVEGLLFLSRGEIVPGQPVYPTAYPDLIQGQSDPAAKGNDEGTGASVASTTVTASPIRHIRITATNDREVSVSFGSSVTSEEGEAEDYRKFAHYGQIVIDERNTSANVHGWIKQFVSFPRLCQFVHGLLSNMDCCNASTVDLFRHQFASLMDTFSDITDPLQALQDPDPPQCDLGLARYVKFKCGITLEKLLSWKPGYPWLRRVLSWMDTFSIELLDTHTKGQSHSTRRAVSFSWNRASQCFLTELVKCGGDIMWHNKEDMVASARHLNSQRPREKYWSEARVAFKEGDTFVIRVSFSFCLADVGGLFTLGAFTTTTVYFQCRVKSASEIELNFIDITGLSGRAASLLMPSMVDALTSSVRAVIQLQPSSDGGDQFNELNVQATGSPAPNSLLLKLVLMIWERLVLTECLFEIMGIWMLFFNALADDFGDFRRKRKRRGRDAQYDVFISYRVDCDAALAKTLFAKLEAKGVRVWLDVKRLEDGLPWESGFIDGLVQSRCFVPILSRAAIKLRFEQLREDSPCDNLLLEHRLAGELKVRRQLERVFPVFVGEMDPATEKIGCFFRQGAAPAPASAACVASVEAKLKTHLEAQGLGPPRLAQQSVQDIFESITRNQGGFVKHEEVSSENVNPPRTLDVMLDRIAERVAKLVADLDGHSPSRAPPPPAAAAAVPADPQDPAVESPPAVAGPELGAGGVAQGPSEDS